MHTDPIADMLTRLHNAERASHLELSIPFSKEKKAILEVLKSHKFIKDIQVEQNKKSSFPELKISLLEKRELNLKRISKPGKRVYLKSKDLKKVKNGLGLSILSTSKGILSNDEARQKHLGGEVLCEIY